MGTPNEENGNQHQTTYYLHSPTASYQLLNYHWRESTYLISPNTLSTNGPAAADE